jgi:hypothetical protein
MTSREIQSAVRVVLRGELAKHAVSEGRLRVYANPVKGLRLSPNFLVQQAVLWLTGRVW